MRQLTITQSITNRDSQSVERYLREISKLGMISMEQEVQLARSIRTGDKNALDKLVHANLRFVVSVAKQYQSRGMSLNDLISEGNVGLIRAAHRFDETKGFKFISYAVWWIRQGIIQALAEKGRMVRIPSNRVSQGFKVQQIIATHEQLYQRTPSAAELAAELNISEEDLQSITGHNMQHYVSMDAPNIHTDESMNETMIDENAKPADNAISYKKSLEIEVMRCLQTLSERERSILCCFFGIGMSEPLSLHDIAHKHSVTRERVRQIKDKAINQLRCPRKSKLLKEYLGA